jgi:hypothetical protein
VRNPLRVLGPRWRTARRRHPGAAAGVETAAAGLRGYARLVGEVQSLKGRVAELERDHRLLAAHVATLTEREGAGPVDDGEPARQRARLAAIAWYEQRLERLERAADGRGHARSARGPAADGRTFGEHVERPS